jgi:hypothetical protein
MPTTLTGLLLFVVLLLPGFVYLTGKERAGAERHVSPFRETVTIVTASITSEITVLILFAILRTIRPSLTPDVGALIRGGSAYLRDHYAQFAVWAISLLALSTVLAYVVTFPAIRRGLAKLHLSGPYPHSSAMSAWWVLFERYANGRPIHVGCTLDDGSHVRGRLASFNTSAEDSPDRELVLAAPIMYRPPRGQQEQEHPSSGVSVSAHRIVALFVTYVEPATRPSQETVAVPEQPQVSMAGQSALASGPPAHPALSGPSPHPESSASAPAAPPDGSLG